MDLSCCSWSSAYDALAVLARCGGFLLLLISSSASAQPVPIDVVELQANSFTACSQRRPGLSRALNGDFVIVWQSCGSLGGDDDAWSLQLRRFAADGRALDLSDYQVNTYTVLDQALPSIATDRDGNFVVVWQSYGSLGGDDDGYSIQARRFGADGAPLDPAELQVNTYSWSWQQRPSLAIWPDGDFVVAWDSWEGYGYPHYEVRARRFRADGTALDASDFRVNTFRADAQFYPAVATLADGGFIVVWGDSHEDEIRIAGRRFDSAGMPIDPVEFELSVLTGGVPRRPAVASDPNGNFVVVWEPQYSEIRARRYRADGVPLDPVEFRVDSGTGTAPFGPDVAVDPGGNFVVAWSAYGSFGDDDSYDSIQARRFRNDGSPVDAQEFQVNSYTTYRQRAASVAVDASGDFVVAWESRGSFGNDDDYWSVQARRFGRPTIPVTTTSGGTGGPDCTLRDAISAASSDGEVGGCRGGSGGGVVELPEGATIALWGPDNGRNGLPVISQPVTIRGRGGRIGRDPGLACPVGPEFRLFEAGAGGILTLRDVAVSNGCLTAEPGGGVLANGGTIVLHEASIEGNESGTSGGGVAVVDGGLIAFAATVRGNLAGTAGGGLSIAGASPLFLLDRTTVSGNAAESGGGLSYASGALGRIFNSTFSGNAATIDAGALQMDGLGSALWVDFSTFTANAAPGVGGLYLSAGEVALHDSLVGDNASGLDCGTAGGVLSASGLDFDTDGSCAALAGAGFTTVASLELGPLADNGGGPPSHLPLAGSPALDAAPECRRQSGAEVIEDGRGYPRPTDDDCDLVAECELGAIERGPIFLDGFERGNRRSWPGP